MMDMEKLISSLPEMKSGEELCKAMQVMPEYRDEFRNESTSIRLMKLSDLYKIYIPSSMSSEIYSKLYLALLRSLQKKCTQLSVRQRYENHKMITQQAYRGIMGGADSFTIIGQSGMGKSSAISRSISLITKNQIIEMDKPYAKIIPCLIVQCPFDSSVKGMLLEILRKVDEELGSNYYHMAVKSRTTTTDMLIGSVSTIAINHIGLLIVDEIQNVVNSKNGKSLIGALTQLINNSGISICMVGTPESVSFFEQAMQLARRSIGLQYTSIPYNDMFISFCRSVFNYQYVREKTEFTPAISQWLYEHSAGIVSVVVALIHDAQEIAILNGDEVLSIDTLNEAYKQRLSFLHSHIQSSNTRYKHQTSIARKKFTLPQQEAINDDVDHIASIGKMVEQSKAEGRHIVSVLKDHFTVQEVAV